MQAKRKTLTSGWYEFDLANGKTVGVRCHGKGEWSIYFRQDGKPVEPTPEGGQEIFFHGYKTAVAFALNY